MPATSLRVAVLVDTFPEVSETFVAAEVRELRRLGVDVELVAQGPARTPDAATAAELPCRFLSDDTTPQRLRALVRLALRHPGRVLADLAARRRWRREEDPLPLRALAPLAGTLEDAGVQLLHAHFGAGAALSALRLGRLLGVPFSVTFHGYDIFLRPMNLPEKVRAAAFVTSGSDYTVAALRDAVPDRAGTIHRIVMGVDPDVWRRSRPVPERGPVVAVGRLVEKKGLATLIDAAGRLRDEDAFAGVVIAGEGPLRAELQDRRDALGLQDLVRMPGALPSHEVRELLEDAAVVAVPAVIASSGDRDSMPVVAKEALALEVPVVASDVAGLPEVVRPPWGALVAPGDADALAGALREILRLGAAERARRGAAGREHVARCCSVAGETARLAELMRSAARRRG